MRFTAFDVETPNSRNDRMSAIGIVLLEDGQIVDRFYSLVDPECRFDPFNIALTGITPQMAAQAPTFAQLWPQIRPWMENTVLLAHNAPFDMAVLAKCLRDYGITWQATAQYACTCRMAKGCMPQLPNHKLDTMCHYLSVDLQHHQADSDAMACAQIFLRLSCAADIAGYTRTYDLRGMRTLPVGKYR